VGPFARGPDCPSARLPVCPWARLPGYRFVGDFDKFAATERSGKSSDGFDRFDPLTACKLTGSKHRTSGERANRLTG